MLCVPRLQKQSQTWKSSSWASPEWALNVRPPPGPDATNDAALMDALETLGYTRTYHMRNVIVNNHQDHWTKLIAMKAANERALTAADFQPVLEGIQVGR